MHEEAPSVGVVYSLMHLCKGCPTLSAERMKAAACSQEEHEPGSHRLDSEAGGQDAGAKGLLFLTLPLLSRGRQCRMR